MPAANIFKVITRFQTLDMLTQRVANLRPAAIAKLRTAFLKQFAAVSEYADANEWSRAVAVCEALAVVGWGKRERVDAIAHFNGDCWETYFINANGDKRFLEARWSKRKKGWQLFNPEYHWSPDGPKAPDRDWREYRSTACLPVALGRLPSQTNYQRQPPIVMGMFGGLDPVSLCVARLKAELDGLLVQHLRPNEYGPGLEFFYLTLHCPVPGDKGQSQLKIGAFRPQQRSFYCDLYFAESFDTLEVGEQKQYLRTNLLTAVDHLEATLRKKKVQYDVAGFRQDVEKALKNWINSGSRRLRSGG
jgi:hypothetical protein